MNGFERPLCMKCGRPQSTPNRCAHCEKLEREAQEQWPNHRIDALHDWLNIDMRAAERHPQFINDAVQMCKEFGWQRGELGRLHGEIERLKKNNRRTVLDNSSITLSDAPCEQENCPTWYDSCNCTVGALEYNIKRAEQAEAELANVHLDLSGEVAANDEYRTRLQKLLSAKAFQTIFNASQNAKFDCVVRTNEERKIASNAKTRSASDEQLDRSPGATTKRTER